MESRQASIVDCSPRSDYATVSIAFTSVLLPPLPPPTPPPPLSPSSSAHEGLSTLWDDIYGCSYASELYVSKYQYCFIQGQSADLPFRISCGCLRRPFSIRAQQNSLSLIIVIYHSNKLCAG